MQDFSQDKAQVLFRSAERAGILSSVSGKYMVPIPSMQNWLVSNYAIKREKDASSRTPNREQDQSRKGLKSSGQGDDPIQWNPDSPAKGKDPTEPLTSPRDTDSGWER